MQISIEQGKTLIIRLMAIGSVVEGSSQRDVWFEVNGEVRAVSVEDSNSAVETVSREKATSDPGSIGAPMSGVVVEVRVKEGQQVKKGDPLCGKCFPLFAHELGADGMCSVVSHECDEGEDCACPSLVLC
jgi:pyruvate carboxylase